MQHVWRPEDNLQELFISSHCVGPGAQLSLLYIQWTQNWVPPPHQTSWKIPFSAEPSCQFTLPSFFEIGSLTEPELSLQPGCPKCLAAAVPHPQVLGVWTVYWFTDLLLSHVCFFFPFIYFMCMNVLFPCMCIHHVHDCWILWNWCYKWLWDTMWVLGTKLRSSIGTLNDLNGWAISPNHFLCL